MTNAASERRTEAHGFTLVELLVVIGIIAVLIAILLPALNKARAQANRVVCQSNIRQLGIAIISYCQDNHGYFPTCAFWDDGVGYKFYPNDWIFWQANRRLADSAIAKYVGGVSANNSNGEALASERLKRLLRCPADNFDGRKPHIGIVAGQGPYLYSYAMNSSAAINARGSNLTGGTKITQWRSPSQKILLTEVYEPFSAAPAWDMTELAWRHGTGFSRGVNIFAIKGKKMGINVSAAFFDGHAECVNDDIACNLYQMQPDMN